VTKIRLLPVVIVSISALLVFKTVGLVSSGGYVLNGVSEANAAGSGTSSTSHGTTLVDEAVTLSDQPTLDDLTPTMTDVAPTLAPTGPAGANASSVDLTLSNPVALDNACAPVPADGSEEAEPGALLVISADCPPLLDAKAQLLTPAGAVPLVDGGVQSTEGVIAERLTERRTELQSYEQELAMRAALVEAAEKRIEERQQTLQTIETQISSLVEERKAMEEGQFGSLVAMYGTMKPKDAASIFDELDMEVLLRVAKMMTPRKMAPIMAAMSTARAQELTMRMATDTTEPAEQMSVDDLAALPQIVGQ
jgi:flagellar motility protein MotE (MotC chaperone)